MNKIAQNIGDLVGSTPLIKLNKIDTTLFGNIYAKCEFLNPTGSIKDRIALYILQEGLKNKTINQDTHIIEATSGNTGVALASICVSLGLKLTIVMPESMSIERQKLMKVFGINLVLTSASSGMQGSIDKAQELQKTIPNSIILDQFTNKNNPKAHITTAKEILDSLENIDIFVASVGTGGTLSGIGKVLKQHNPSIKIVAIEPYNSAVLTKGLNQPHKIQGIGAGFIPKTLDTNIYDEVVTVKDDDAINMAKELITKEGLLVGISSGANVYVAQQLAKQKENKDKNIVTILCDTAQRYMSTELFDS